MAVDPSVPLCASCDLPSRWPLVENVNGALVCRACLSLERAARVVLGRCAYCNHPWHGGKPCEVAVPWCSCRGQVSDSVSEVSPSQNAK
jgi:hypothetical protein